MHCTARHWTLPHGSFELPFTSPKTQTQVTENQAKPRRQEAKSQPRGSPGNIPTCALQWAAGCGLISFYPWLTFSPHFLSSSEKYPRVNSRKQKYPKASAERQGWNKSPEAPKCRHTLSIATATIPKSLGPGYSTDRSDTPPGSARCRLSDSRAFLQAKWFTRAPGPPIGIFHLPGY